MEQEYEVEVEWLPFELHPGIPPGGKPLPDYVRRSASMGAHDRLREMAQEAGLPWVTHDRMVSSRQALEASEYAREQGKHPEFHKIMFRKYYGEGQDMSDWEVIRSAAAEAGLDPDEMQSATERGIYRNVVDSHIQQAYRSGIQGVPAYILGNKYLIRGAQPYEIFQQVMAELLQEPEGNGQER